ncbi:hypothetical protein HY837_01205 [archaeon]|nr:hypothetical protein [archaeon]
MKTHSSVDSSNSKWMTANKPHLTSELILRGVLTKELHFNLRKMRGVMKLFSEIWRKLFKIRLQNNS